jgi:hypothetical protein
MTDILDLPMGPNDADAATVRDYLKALLLKLWQEDEGFSGKRPFGNSGWKYEVYTALVKAGAVPGKLDAEGYVQECDDGFADQAILAAIAQLR